MKKVFTVFFVTLCLLAMGVTSVEAKKPLRRGGAKTTKVAKGKEINFEAMWSNNGQTWDIKYDSYNKVAMAYDPQLKLHDGVFRNGELIIIENATGRIVERFTAIDNNHIKDSRGRVWVKSY